MTHTTTPRKKARGDPQIRKLQTQLDQIHHRRPKDEAPVYGMFLENDQHYVLSVDWGQDADGVMYPSLQEVVQVAEEALATLRRSSAPFTHVVLPYPPAQAKDIPGGKGLRISHAGRHTEADVILCEQWYRYWSGHVKAMEPELEDQGIAIVIDWGDHVKAMEPELKLCFGRRTMLRQSLRPLGVEKAAEPQTSHYGFSFEPYGSAA